MPEAYASQSRSDSPLDQQLENLAKDELGIGQEDETDKYRPKNKKERAVRRQVYDRFYELRDDPARAEAEAEWEIADKEYRMYFDDLDPEDWRANLHLPDAFSAIQTQMQETIERRSRPRLAATEDSDEPIEDFSNAVMTYNMNNTDFDNQYYLGRLSAAIRGTAFFKCYWRQDKRVVKDPTSVNDEGEIEYQDKEVIDIDDDYMEWKPNEYIYIDEKALHMNDAVDGIEREILPINEFRRIYDGKPGFMNVNKVARGGDTSVRSFFRMPKDINEDDVEVLHYYNRSIDAYWVVANNVVIRMTPIPYKHKELPFAVLYQYRVPNRFYGVGIPKIIHYLSEERRSIRNLNIDRQKLQLSKMFIHNSAFDFDEEEMSVRPGGMMSIDTNGLSIREAILPLEYGDVTQSYFRSEEILLEDIRRAHGIDDRIVVSDSMTTATQAAIVKESSLKRLNMISIQAEMDTIIRVGRLKWSNIQFFYPVPRMEKITQDNEERDKPIFRQINIKGKKFSVVNDDGSPRLKMDDVKGSSALVLDKKMAKYMQGSYDITVTSDVYTPVNKALHQAKITEMATLLMSNPATMSVMDPQKTAARIITANEEDPEKWLIGDGRSVKDMQMLAEAENMVMAGGQPLAPTEGATEEHTLVHLWYTKSVDFANLPEQTQQIIMDHIMGEHDANPATGASADLLGGDAPPIPPGGQPAPTVGNQPMGIPSDTGATQVQVADNQANTV